MTFDGGFVGWQSSGEVTGTFEGYVNDLGPFLSSMTGQQDLSLVQEIAYPWWYRLWTRVMHALYWRTGYRLPPKTYSLDVPGVYVTDMQVEGEVVSVTFSNKPPPHPPSKDA